jgi:hypothetical protein
VSDEIVTRLREWVVVPTNDFLDEDIKEAADEIERLRAKESNLLHLWKVLMAAVHAEQIARGYWLHGRYSAEDLNAVSTDRERSFTAFDKAVRGE